MPTLPATAETLSAILTIESIWSTNTGVGISGWCVGKGGTVTALELKTSDETPLVITNWENRPDIKSRYAQYDPPIACGFSQEFVRDPQREIFARIEIAGRTHTTTLRYSASIPVSNTNVPIDADAWPTYRLEVNERKLRILEIGSRLLTPLSASHRTHFPNSRDYVGLDYYPGPNVDVVGDAHKLSTYFHGQRFGAIHSFSVMEHLAMPWVAALEMIKCLEVGGIMYHHVPFSWPMHELPWDFFRFSAEAYRVLFPPNLGMKIERLTYDHPLHLYFDEPIPGQTRFPLVQSFGFAAAMVRKVEDVDYSGFQWNMTLPETLGDGSHYPRPIS